MPRHVIVLSDAESEDDGSGDQEPEQAASDEEQSH